MRTELLYQCFLGGITICGVVGVMSVLTRIGVPQMEAGFAVLIAALVLAVINIEHYLLSALELIERKTDEVRHLVAMISVRMPD